MSTNRTPLTGQPLEQPDPAPLRVNAIWDRDKPCTEHHAPYAGRIPCTGVLRCSLCLTEWDPVTGALIKRQPATPSER